MDLSHPDAAKRQLQSLAKDIGGCMRENKKNFRTEEGKTPIEIFVVMVYPRVTEKQVGKLIV